MSNKVKVPGGAFYAGDGLTVDPINRTVSAGGSGSQADWNQNDSTAPDYVKNRPFYEKPLVSVPSPQIPNMAWYKVSDSVPTGDHSLNAACTYVTGAGKIEAQISMSTDDYYAASELAVFVALTDNVVITEVGLTFPEKGTYFLSGEGFPLITGFALGRDADPEITWDGSTEEIKTMDEKFIPDVSGLTFKSSTANSTKKFKITVDDSGTISATEVTA